MLHRRNVLQSSPMAGHDATVELARPRNTHARSMQETATEFIHIAFSVP
jgi:hypothetical protein